MKRQTGLSHGNRTTLNARHPAVASCDALQHLTKFLQKPDERSLTAVLSSSFNEEISSSVKTGGRCSIPGAAVPVSKQLPWFLSQLIPGHRLILLEGCQLARSRCDGRFLKCICENSDLNSQQSGRLTRLPIVQQPLKSNRGDQTLTNQARKEAQQQQTLASDDEHERQDYRIYQTTQNMAVGLEVVFWFFFPLHTCVRVCVCDGDKQRGQSAAESDEMR